MITAMYAGCLGLMMVALGFNVTRYRRRYRSALGDAGEMGLIRVMRAHGNLAEYAPLFIVLLALAEWQKLPAYAVHVLGVVFIAGRVMHAYSLLAHERYVDGKIQHFPKWRTAGMICTFNVLGILSIILLIQFLSQSFSA